MSKKCYLQCIFNKTKKIYVQENETVILGRNRVTAIQDPNLSRNHLECKAEFDPDQLIVKTTGKCYSGCNGYALMLNETYPLKHDDVLELRLGYHQFKIVFEKENNGDDSPHEHKPQFSIFDKAKRKTETGSGRSQQAQWENIPGSELLIFTPENCSSSSLIASFDVDGTIIKTKSGARFPKDKNDWEWNFNFIPKTLGEYFDKDFKIVFFTNQSGVGNNSDKIKDFKAKMEKIVSELSIPVQIFVALGKNMFRKPVTGMWKMLVEMKNENFSVDMEKSFYVGDAAGREKDWAPKKKKDHSNADRLFAQNIGLPFYTPEEFFLKSSKNPFKLPVFNPKDLKVTEYPNYLSDTQDIILMVGSQGSGKSHFCKTELIPKGYMHINRDSLNSWQKCVQLLEECILKKKNAVIDNTNPDKSTRKKYLSIAQQHNVKCRCFVMSTTFEHCKHNNRFRGLTDKGHEFIGDMLLYSYKKNFEPPELTEGFNEILNIPFIPSFNSKENEQLYKMYLLES